MTGAGSAAARPTPRRKPRTARSPLGQVGQLVARIAAILLVAGLIVAGATAVGYSPLGAVIPGPFLSVGEQRQGPPPGVTQAAPAGSPDQAGGGVPRGRGPQRGQAGGAPTERTQGPGAGAAGQGLFAGRNAPSLQRGLPEELRYLAMFGVLTAAVALALRVPRPRRRRSARLGLSPSA